MLDMDSVVIRDYLDTAQLHAAARNDWAEGYWLGRAIEAARQNAIDPDWLVAELDARGLDKAIVAEPKQGDPNPRDN